MRSGQIIRIGFFTHRLFVLCERLQIKTVNKNLYCELKVFNWLHFICFESLQKKVVLLTNSGYFTFLTYFSNCTSIVNLEQLSVITCVCVCVCGGENCLQIRAFVWGEGKGFVRLWCLLARVCVCLNSKVSQPLRPLSVVSC